MPKVIESEWVSIPAGTFLMGSEEERENELPVHSVWMDNFAITKYPVTNREYVRFVEATGHRQPGGWKLLPTDYSLKLRISLTTQIHEEQIS